MLSSEMLAAFAFFTEFFNSKKQNSILIEKFFLPKKLTGFITWREKREKEYWKSCTYRGMNFSKRRSKQTKIYRKIE